MATPVSSAHRADPQAKDLQLLDDFYRTYYQQLAAYVRRQQDSAEVEDVVQDVFERLARTAAGPGVRQPRAYLYETARHVIADRYRRRYTEGRAHDALQETDTDAEPSPEVILEGRTSLTAVFHAIIGLPEAKCLAFLLARFDELTVREISELLGTPRSTVQDHLHEAMQACRQAALA